MSFLDEIFAQLEAAGDTVVLEELGGDARQAAPVQIGRDLLGGIAKARAFLSARGLKKGDRCALLANNSARWVAMDLAIMAEGLIVVPLYARQAPAELVVMLKDCSPSLMCCGDAALRDRILQQQHKGWGSLMVRNTNSWLTLIRSLLFIPPVRPVKRKGLCSRRGTWATCWAARPSGSTR
jgi:acyl-CoA synthetase (AMP-forming)/AMP-acid ligase II